MTQFLEPCQKSSGFLLSFFLDSTVATEHRALTLAVPASVSLSFFAASAPHPRNGSVSSEALQYTTDFEGLSKIFKDFPLAVLAP